MGVKFTSSLTNTQKQIWFDCKLNPTSTMYLSSYKFALEGDLDVNVIMKAWYTLIKRHDALRTYFLESEGVPQQVVLNNVDNDGLIEFYDFTELNYEEALENVTKIESRIENFNLSKWPLHKIHLFKVGTNAFNISIYIHHILIDYSSFNILIDELGKIYNSQISGNPLLLPKIKVNIKDYAEQEQNYINKFKENSTKYWIKTLENFTPMVHLATSKTQNNLSIATRKYFTINSETYRQLKKIAYQRKTTTFNVLAACYIILLYRFTNQEDITIGYPSGRRIPGFNLLIGFFINNLPLRVNLSNNISFYDTLDIVTSYFTRPTYYDYYPLNEIAKIVRQNQNTKGTELFNNIFSSANFATQGIKLQNIKVTSELTQIQESAKDFLFLFDDQTANVRCAIEYNVSLFQEELINSYVNSFLQLLQSILDYPDTPISRLNILNKKYVSILYNKWSTGVKKEWEESNIIKLIEKHAHNKPKKIAVVSGDKTLTYQELNEMANKVAHYLRGIGVGAEKIVAISLERGIEQIVWIIGILKSGGCYIPIDPSYPKDRQKYILEDSGAEILITSSALSSQYNSYYHKRVIEIELLEEGLSDYSSKNPPLITNEDNLAYVIYTSGSTGKPKGVMIEHKGLSNLAQAQADLFHINQDSKVLQFAPMSFDASVTEWSVALISGASLYLMPGSDKEVGNKLVDTIVTNEITVAALPPSVVAALPESTLKNLKILIVGGEVCSEQVIEYWSNRLRLINVYGPTECTVCATTFECDTRYPNKTIGRPISNIEVYILDENLQFVPEGVVGELYLGGKGIARGYLNNPQLTEERFITKKIDEHRGEIRLYKTGDLGRWLSDGNIEYIGREDFQVKIRGYRVELGEIENVLARVEDVREVVVIAQGENQQRLVAYIVPKFDILSSELSQNKLKQELQECAAEHLPSFMVPSSFMFVDSIPLTANGKIDKNQLIYLEGYKPLKKATLIRPRTIIEKKLVKIWCDLLQLENISIEDNFFELGGDSIICIQLISAAKQEGVFLEIKDVFAHPTILSLGAVAKLDNNPIKEITLFEEKRSDDNIPLTPIQHWFFEQNFYDYNYYNQAIIMKSTTQLDPVTVSKVCRFLLKYYDIFSIRFKKEGDNWKQYYIANELIEKQIAGCFSYDIDSTDEQRLHEIASELQSKLNITSGPIFCVAILNYSDLNQYILFISHHLYIDNVSWRILLDDFEKAYKQVVNNLPIDLPTKTHSYNHWAHVLSSYANSDKIKPEIKFWNNIVSNKTHNIKTLNSETSYTLSDSVVVKAKLTTEETKLFIHKTPEAYRTQINDILLTALLMAYGDLTGKYEIYFNLEGHGREHIEKNLDLSRTIGWFTSFFPVYLSISDNQNLGVAIKEVKEQLRKIPNNGIGFGILQYLGKKDCTLLDKIPLASIIFNYLGQLDNTIKKGGLLESTTEFIKFVSHSQNQCSHPIEISAQVKNDIFEISWSFNPNNYSVKILEDFAKKYIEHLKLIIKHCTNLDTFGYTPSDFPLARINQQSLDRIFRQKRDIEEIYPLSPLQLGLLFNHLMDKKFDTYIVQTIYSFAGEIIPEIFKSAWEEVTKNFEIFRTGFVWDNLDDPLQFVKKESKVIWNYEDWSNLPTDKQQLRLQRLLNNDRQQQFNLNDPPLSRSYHIKISQFKHYLLWTHHHILLDGWCGPIILSQFLTAYQQLLHAQQPLLLKPPPYKNFVSHLITNNKNDNDFWSKYLLGFDSLTYLNCKLSIISQPSIQSYEHYEFKLTRAESDRVRTAAKRLHITLNSLIQGAWAVLLSFYTQSEDVMFGVTVSGRNINLDGIEEMVGLLINTLPLRVKVKKEEKLEDFLAALQGNMAQINLRAHTPLAKISSYYNQSEHHELFNNILVFENFPVDQDPNQIVTNLKLVKIEAFERTEYPLTFTINASKEITLKMSFETSHFDIEAIKQLTSYFYNILNSMLVDTTMKIRNISMLSAQEEGTILKDWNNTFVAYEKDQTIVQIFEQQVQKDPEALALVFENQKLSYDELNKKVNKLAKYLQSVGVKEEVIVAVCVERSLELIIGLLALMKAGGVYLPLDPGYPIDRLEYMLRDANSKVILTDIHNKNIIDKCSNNLNQYNVIILDQNLANSLELFDDKDLENTVKTENAAYIIYTSGSTGQPKGVINLHKGLFNRLEWMQNYFQLTVDDKVLHKTSISFDVSIWEMLWPILNGSSIVIAKPQGHKDADYIAEIIDEQGITVIHFVPSMLSIFITETKIRLPNPLKLVICSGESLSIELKDKFFSVFSQVKLYNLYGPTEASIDVAAWQCVNNQNTNILPIGKPISNMQLYILDMSRRPVGVGVSGELYIGGVGLARGYLNKPELTTESFVNNPFAQEAGEKLYKTGDLARYIENGNIQFLGRIDNQIKLRGYRIELGEIETVLSKHKKVQSNVVIVQDDKTGQPKLVAYIVAKKIQLADDNKEKEGIDLELSSYLRSKLPEYMVPSYFITINQLPINPNGKLDKNKLPAVEAKGSYSKKKFVAPKTEIEKIIADIWSNSILFEKDIGVHDNFFNLGGDSIITIQFVSRARRQGIYLDVKQVFQFPTVYELAQVAKFSVPDKEYLYKTKELYGPILLTPIQKWFFSKVQFFNHYNQSTLLELEVILNLEDIELFTKKLLHEHDALSFYFTKGESGWLQQKFNDKKIAKIKFCTEKNLKFDDTSKLSTILEKECNLIQSSLDIERGELFKIVLFNLSNQDKQKLFIVFHHLIIDGISWRIFFEEFNVFIKNKFSSSVVNYDNSSQSYASWSIIMQQYADSEKLIGEIEYWTSVKSANMATPPEGLQNHLGDNNNIFIKQKIYTAALNKTDTTLLINKVHEAYKTKINDVLLTALTQAFGDMTKTYSIYINLEGHGRESISEQQDLSKTFGWFTTIFPAYLNLEQPNDLASSLKYIKEYIRSIPSNGIGYGALRYLRKDIDNSLNLLKSLPDPKIIFNNLGQWDNVNSENTFFKISDEPKGDEIDIRNQLDFDLVINCLVKNHIFEIHISYNSNKYLDDTIMLLAERYLIRLSNLIKYCSNSDSYGYSPSDFPLSSLNQKQLDQIFGGQKNIKDIYPLGPMQAGFIFLSLRQKTKEAYFIQNIYGINNIEAEALKDSWESMFEQFDILRTGFCYKNSLNKPLQYVLQDLKLPWVVHDLQNFSEELQKLKLEELAKQDVTNGFDLSNPPLIRLQLVQFAKQVNYLIISYHHILMDGWCIPMFLNKLFSRYSQIRSTKNFTIKNPTIPYKSYIQWLSKQDNKKAEDFWAKNLVGFSSPTYLKLGVNISAIKENLANQYADFRFSINNRETKQIIKLSKDCAVTLNTLVQVAWGLLLHQNTKQDDLIFGVTVSGRSIDLPNVENIFGLFINTIPLRMKILENDNLQSLLNRVQLQMVSVQEYSYLSLAKIQSLSELDNNISLFNTIIVFENYPKLNIQVEGKEIKPFSTLSQGEHPLGITVVPGDELLFKFDYSIAEFSPNSIEKIANNLKEILLSLTEDL